MSFKLILKLQYGALLPDKPGCVMRSGSLCALKKISGQGISIVLADKLSDDEQNDEAIYRLLEQEEIPYHTLEDLRQAKKVTEVVTVSTVHDASSGVAGQGGEVVARSVQDQSLLLASEDDKNRNPHTFRNWKGLSDFLLGGFRKADHHRKTGETDISVRVHLDGSGQSSISTGIPFYDHMLDQIARHGFMDIDIQCKGDLEIDEHHTIEDTAIALGEAIGKALGEKRGIGRYGFVVSMDETRSLAALDLSGRPWCVFEGTFRREKVGDFPTEMTAHFFHSFAMALRATLHVAVTGDNDHHKIEACFKSLARCLRQAVDRNEQYRDILPSSKGILF